MALVPYQFDAELAPSIWPKILPLVEASVRASGGTITVEEIKDDLFKGRAVCIGTGDENGPALMSLAAIVQYPTYRAARVLALGGDRLGESMQHISVLEDWALMQGCVEIEGWCDPTQGRLMRKLGWKHARSKMVWDLRRRLP